MASLQVCLSAAGAQCKLINKPRSVPVETLVVKESIVVGLKDDLGSSDEIEWAEEVNDFLVRYKIYMYHRRTCRSMCTIGAGNGLYASCTASTKYNY